MTRFMDAQIERTELANALETLHYEPAISNFDDAGYAGRPAGAAQVNHVYSWRDGAINDALRGFNYAQHIDALLEAIRVNRPDCSTSIIWPDREQLMRFLRDHCQGFRSMLTGSHRYHSTEENEYFHYTGWFAAEWKGETVEVAIAPDYGTYLDAICIAPNDRVLVSFTDALTAFSKRLPGRCLRYAKGWQHAPDIERELGSVNWDDLVLPADVPAKLQSAVEGFARNKAAYRKLGFAWRRGILLIGPPGTGKTMVCKAAATALPEFPFLYVRDLNEHEHHDAIRAIFQRARELAPCILAIEDIDGLVNPGNRTVFLNEMDGFTNNEGILVIASSNYPERIDEALLRRPSRFDQVFHLGLPEKQERYEFCRRSLARRELAEHIVDGFSVDELARQVADRTDGFTPAYLKEALVSAALQCAQQGDLQLDSRYGAAVLAQVAELRAHLSRTKNPEALAEMSSSSAPVGFRR